MPEKSFYCMTVFFMTNVVILKIQSSNDFRTEIVISKDTAGLGGAREGLPIVEFDLICFAASAISKAYKVCSIISIQSYS